MSNQTHKNLKEAFSGESQANRRYLAYSKKADEEGFTNMARLFRVIAESETIHALNHLNALGDVKTTAKNVKDALKGETEECTGMYPMFIDQAERDADNAALNSFFWASEAERTHADFFEKAVNALKEGKDLELGDLHICKICGYTVEGEPPDKCPTCGKGKEAFVPVA
ncbi:MAG: rubrerythrin family protein [Desulfatiglandaceae bacterium]|jgi:rubrerythrin